MSRYLLRRLLIAVPSLIGISIVLYTVLALAPGDPFGELATNPNVPAEVAATLRAKFGLTIRCGCVTCIGWWRCCKAIGGFHLSAAWMSIG